MQSSPATAFFVFAIGVCGVGGVLFAQAPAVAEGAGVFPTRPPGDKAAIERGRNVYATNCAYCHGEDARGGENGGTNILRSEYIMKDRNGEVLRRFLLNPGETAHVAAREGVLKFSFTPGEAADIAAFIHDFRLSSRDAGRMRPPTIVVGDATAGQIYFNAKCASCHSVTGDLRGIAAKFADPIALQQTWLMPRVYGLQPGLAGVTVTVTQRDGQRFEGELGRLDDFIVTLTQVDGTQRTFNREHGNPRVEVHDPMREHRELLPGYTDKEIHDVTAYLVTIK